MICLCALRFCVFTVEEKGRRRQTNNEKKKNKEKENDREEKTQFTRREKD